MSVLIRGMKMPTSCANCPIGNTLCCPLMPGVPALWAEYTNAVREKRMHNNCPLIPIPQHGRLIDADRLKNIIFESLNKAITDYNSTPFGEALCTSIAKNIVDEIEATPTIIQADKPKKEVSNNNAILKIEEK